MTNEFLFSWDDIPGNDNDWLIEFLKKRFDISWVETAKIEKIDDDRTIKISTGKNFLWLILNDKKSKINLKIDDCINDEFIVRRENGKLRIYQQTKIDLRGCKYDRIDPISIWKQLMDCLDPFDRQPFTQLEETFRRAGKDDLADDVYFMVRCKEFAEIRKFTENNITIRRPLAWINRFLWLLEDGFLLFLVGYGVRVKRLIFPIIFILLLGTVVFHNPGAVILKSDLNQTSFNQTSVIQPHNSYWESFWVSLNLFLPLEIPAGAYWDPSPNFTTFGTFLKIAGWFLVPLGVAGISGILKRKA